MTRRRKIWLTLIGVLLLTAVAGYVDYPKSPNIRWGAFQRDLNVRLGLDLQGGTSLLYQADVSKIPAADRLSALAGVRDVIERRVNSFGVSEPTIQTSQVGGQYRVSVDLAGVKD